MFVEKIYGGTQMVRHYTKNRQIESPATCGKNITILLESLQKI